VTNRGLSLLRARGLAPKKSFGQHFLHDQKRVARIAELATTPEGGMVLEIGAGVGALTDVLAERAARVVAIERDRDLVPLLRELMAEHENVEVVEADAVRLAWREHLEAGPSPRVVAGNLPYQLTGRLLERAVEHARELDRVVFMVQEEVADRIVAAPGGREYGALSVFVQAAFRVERALRIGPGAFSPPPEVSSAVIVLDPLAEPRAEETPLFREVVKGAFATRRKTLRNSWRKLLARDVLEEAAREAGIDLDARAETLSAEDYARMTAVVAALRRDG
jgi:16S rRNA (adenine1518-N6/adenine1519-N6)-dimethyltransferase